MRLPHRAERPGSPGLPRALRPLSRPIHADLRRQAHEDGFVKGGVGFVLTASVKAVGQ